MSLASRTTGGGSPEEARRVAEVDVTFAGAGGEASADGADVVVGADSAVATDVVAGADPMGGAGAAAVVGLPVLPDAAAAAGAGGVTVVADVDRVNPGGVSGANPGVWDADDSSPVGFVEVELVAGTDADRADVVDVESRAAAIEVDAAAPGEVGAADLGEVDAAAACEVEAGFNAAATGAAAGCDDDPPRFEVPCPLAEVEPLPFEVSLCGANKPSKNARRGWDGAICLSLSTFVRAPLKSSALKADSVCATNSTTSCEYCGA
jgi:hypothetical protein